ncbi:MAG: DedA family protein [Candidatus Methanoperedens sp.]|nr:DedA family protein [Candidatus Methanoperedens sp.]
MFESLESILLNYGYQGLFLASFLASTILPFGSEGILVYLVQKKFNIPALVLVAAVGNFLGACTSYYIGFKGRILIEKYLRFDPKELEKGEQFFTKYGLFVLLFTWLPFIGDVFTVVGGLLRTDFKIFSVLVFTGKFLRYLAVAYLANAIL